MRNGFHRTQAGVQPRPWFGVPCRPGQAQGHRPQHGLQANAAVHVLGEWQRLKAVRDVRHRRGGSHSCGWGRGHGLPRSPRCWHTSGDGVQGSSPHQMRVPPKLETSGKKKNQRMKSPSILRPPICRVCNGARNG